MLRRRIIVNRLLSLTISKSTKSTTTFGDITVINNTIINEKIDLDLIPKSELLKGTKLPSEINHHLRWLAQKYNQKQNLLVPDGGAGSSSNNEKKLGPLSILSSSSPSSSSLLFVVVVVGWSRGGGESKLFLA